MTGKQKATAWAGTALMGMAGILHAQNTVVDQNGTEFLIDALPPDMQAQVVETQGIVAAGGGEGPLRVDEMGRFYLDPDGQGGRVSDSVLVDQLLGIVVLPRPGDVRAEGWPGVEGIWHDFDDFPKEVGEVMQGYLYQPVSLASLDEMVRNIIIAYRNSDRPVVDVLLPEQDITSGVVQLVVIESELGDIRIEGVDTDTEEYLRNQMRIKEDEVITSSEVLQDLAWLNRSPYRKVDLIYAPGYEFGTSDIILNVSESQKSWFYTGYENSGTELLGEHRMLFGFNWGDAFGPDKSLSYQFTTDTEFDAVNAHSLVYTQGLPWRHWLTVLGSHVTVDADIPVGDGTFVTSGGKNTQLSMRYGIPLPGKANRRREMDFGFDYKSNNNNLEFGGTDVFDTTVEIFQLSAGYKLTAQGRKGVTQVDLRGFYSPGDLTNYNNDETFQESRADSTADYLYATLGIEHQRRLREDWSVRLKGQGQVSNGNLQASEQLGAGGYDTVRGFEQRIARSDEGFWSTVELYTPEISIGRIFDWENETDELRLLTFFDTATLTNVNRLPDEPNQVGMQSVGAGFRWRYSDWFRLRFDYGYPVTTQNIEVDQRGRFHIGATANF
ncbi:MAG: ShlB/FhaC/HecB family hemolysin secretion/activation protein [Verrucomicrobiales bacterium]|nr:ShlB/FhaC/HecB family hemolysin secretion/activation protein [Verrucomicrobiales bacterium]